MITYSSSYVSCMLDDTKFKHKPSTQQTKTIQHRLKKVNIPLSDLILELGSGASFKPALLNGTKGDSWISQQLFALDFDGNTTIEAEIQRAKEKSISIAFGYTTFNHTPEHHRFRLIFMFSHPIFELQTHKDVVGIFKWAFPNADPRCFDKGRLFFGGLSIIDTERGLLDLDWLLSKYREKLIDYNLEFLSNASTIKTPKASSVLKNFDGIVSNVEYLIQRDVKKLNQVLNLPFRSFQSADKFWEYVCSTIPLNLLLGIEQSGNFGCIFHNDSSPSANIFKGDNGYWYYKCFAHSCNTPHVLDARRTIEWLTDSPNVSWTIYFIEKIYNCKLLKSQWCIEQEQILLDNISTVYKKDFETYCPTANKNLATLMHLYTSLCQVALSNIYSEDYSDNGDLVFFVSLSKLAETLQMGSKDRKLISKKLSFLARHGLIHKCSEEEIPKVLLDRAKFLNKNSNRQFQMHTNFYKISSLVGRQLSLVEQSAKECNELGYTIGGMSYETIFCAEGKEIAEKIYPQYSKVKNKKAKILNKETGEIELVPDFSSQRDLRVAAIYAFIEQEIQANGYVKDSTIISELGKTFGKKLIEEQLLRIRGEMPQRGYRHIKATKEVRSQYGISGKGVPYVVVRN